MVGQILPALNIKIQMLSKYFRLTITIVNSCETNIKSNFNTFKSKLLLASNPSNTLNFYYHQIHFSSIICLISIISYKNISSFITLMTEVIIGSAFVRNQSILIMNIHYFT